MTDEVEIITAGAGEEVSHVNVFPEDTNYQRDVLTETQQVLVLLLECRIGR